jgi:hypothetical protein
MIQGFNNLLRTYQHSIVRAVSAREETYGQYPEILLPSWPRNPGTFISANSYPWLCEVRCRTHTVESLLFSAVAEMRSAAGRSAIDLPVIDVSEAELTIRIERFIREGLNLLFGIADSTAKFKNIHIIRAYQRTFLESLPVTELAILGILVRVLGMAYFRNAKKADGGKANDSIRDKWIVFEDRLLRSGPFLAYATSSTTPAERTIQDWSEEVIAQGLKDMEDFETGRCEGYASLQSVLWKLFCAREECDIFNSWEIAKELVEKQMISYDV